MYSGCFLPQTPLVESVFSAFEAFRQPQFYFTGEAHDFFEMVCILDGTAEITADENIFLLSPGQMLIHPPLEFHRIRTVGNDPLHVAIFSFSAKNLKNKRIVVPFGKQEEEQIHTLLCLAKDCFECEDSEDLWTLRLRPDQIDTAKEFKNQLEHLLLHFKNDSETPLQCNTTAEARHYGEILQILKKHLDISLSISEIAKLCNLSPSSVKKVVHNFSGMGVMTLYHELKLQKACNLLRENQGIQEISYALGFEDPNYFSTFFKRKLGVSPTQWRKQQLPLSYTEIYHKKKK